MINRILILSYYHPWISGGGHRPVCLLEQDLARNREVVFLYESDTESELMETFQLYNHPNLMLVKRDKYSGKLCAVNKQAQTLIVNGTEEAHLIIRWRPDYVRSHNPVQSFIPILHLCQELNVPHIYDQMDYWDGFNVKPWGESTEKQYIDLANECITISNWLINNTQIPNNSHVIANAIKTEFLESCKMVTQDVIRERSSHSEKIVLYSGALWPDWFDWDLVQFVVKKRPEYKFIFLGAYIPSSDEDDGRQVEKIVQDLSVLPNVSFLGQVSHRELLPYLKEAHVGLIPFVVNSVTEACSPLKCFEYIGAYLPVVSTNLPEINNYPLVKIAYEYEEFLSFIDLSLNQDVTFDTFAEVDEFLQQSTWEQRSRDLDCIAENMIEKLKVRV